MFMCVNNNHEIERGILVSMDNNGGVREECMLATSLFVLCVQNVPIPMLLFDNHE